MATRKQKQCHVILHTSQLVILQAAAVVPDLSVCSLRHAQLTAIVQQHDDASWLVAKESM